jgi:hypothetical protein
MRNKLVIGGVLAVAAFMLPGGAISGGSTQAIGCGVGGPVCGNVTGVYGTVCSDQGTSLVGPVAELPSVGLIIEPRVKCPA